MASLEEKDFSEKLDLSIWKKIFVHLKNHKKLVAIVGFAMLGVSILDLASPLITRYAINNIIEVNSPDKMLPFVIVSALVSAALATLVGVFIYVSGKLESEVAHDIRREAFLHIHKLTFSFHDTTPVGFLMARLTSDITLLGQTVGWSMVDVTWSIGTIVGVIIVMLLLNWKLALFIIAVVPILTVVMMFFQKQLLNLQRKVRSTNSKITRSLNESIMGARTTKTLVIEDLNFQEFKNLTNTMRTVCIKAQVMGSLFWPMIRTLGSIAVGLALWQGGILKAKDVIDLGTLTAFINYAGQFLEPLTSLARVFSEFQSAQASAERVIALIETPVDILEKDGVEEIYGTLFEPKKENWPKIDGNIRFENVKFHYNTGEAVLKDFSLDVKTGETIALVGETGSGKSTIVNLLCRFYEPVEGNIYIDDVDYRDRTQHWLQSNLGFVLQSPHLFSGTVRDNICYGKVDATDEQVDRAVELVNAKFLIEKLSKGYDTEVGEGGNLLSTGEKQLICFARAIIKDPKIFVLDEATSSIDTEIEQKIQDAITKVLKGRTSFIIAHRLSTIKNADKILVVKQGEVIEQGSHDELIKLKQYYYKLYTNQFKEQESKKILKK